MFRPVRQFPTFDDLIATLDTARISAKQPALYQTISQVIKRIRQFNQVQGDINTDINNELTQIEDSIIAINVTINNLPTPEVQSFSYIPMATGEEPLDFMSNGVGEPLLIGFSTTQPV